MAKFRGYCFTLNNYTEDEENIIYSLPWEYSDSYGVVGKEIGESGTPHLQGYIRFKNATSFNTVKALLPRAHWESQQGTVDQAANYCKKEDDYFEWGIKPMSQAEKGECGKLSAKDQWKLIEEERYEELPPQYYRAYKAIHAERFATVEDNNELDNIWICGKTGCGKSRYVREHYPGFYYKQMNKWWDGYNHEDNVLLDDFDPEHGKFLAYYLKTWADHYAFNAEVKGGMIKCRPKRIIVTSQYPLEACFARKEDIDAIKRRFKIVQLSNF